MTWSKIQPGPGMYRCRGPRIAEAEIIVCVYEEGVIPPGGIKLRVVRPKSYNLPGGLAPTTFGHGLYRDAEWAPYEEG